jgi:hypothetical protein
MVSINVYGFSLKGYGFPLHGNGFPLHGNFWQNLFSAEKLKIFVKILDFFSKLHVQGSIIEQVR